MLEVITMRGYVKAPDRKNYGPYQPFTVDSGWYSRMARSHRHLIGLDDYREKVRSFWKEPTLRGIARARKIDDTLPLDALRDALCTFGDAPAPAPKEVVEEVAPAPAPAEEPTLDVDLGALEAAYSSDDFRAVQELLRPLGITGKARADLYPHAERLLGLED